MVPRQALGPNVQSSLRAEPIGDDDETVEPGDNDWETSWEGAWTLVIEDDVATSRESEGVTIPEVGPEREFECPVPLSEPSEDHDGETSGGKSGSSLSTGALAAIATGASAGALVVVGAGAAFFFWKRRQKKGRQDPGDSGNANRAKRADDAKGPPNPVTELHGDSRVRVDPVPPQELP